MYKKPKTSILNHFGPIEPTLNLTSPQNFCKNSHDTLYLYLYISLHMITFILVGMIMISAYITTRTSDSGSCWEDGCWIKVVNPTKDILTLKFGVD